MTFLAVTLGLTPSSCAPPGASDAGARDAGSHGAPGATAAATKRNEGRARGSRIAMTANSSIYQRENSVGVATLSSLRRPDNDSRFEAFVLFSS
jgi:hypothetical protein